MSDITWSNICPPYPKYNYFRENIEDIDARVCIDASILAYSDLPFAVPVFERAGLKVIDFIDIEGTQCYVLEKNASLIVVFRGTQSNLKISGKHSLEVFMDMLTDMDIRMSLEDNCKVHTGFNEAIRRIWMRLLRTIANRKVVFTGHSLGGALATMAAFKYSKSSNVESLYTFGSPKVGDEKFANVINIGLLHKSFHYIYGHDGVPLLPSLVMGYANLEKTIHLNKEWLDYPRKFKRGCLPVPRFLIPIPAWIHDHVPTLYAEKLWEKV